MAIKVVKYGAPWCNACNAATKLLGSREDIVFKDINIEDNDASLEGKNIRSIPYIEFYKEGADTPTATHIGALTLIELNNIMSNLTE